jgi:hypothetical protein
MPRRRHRRLLHELPQHFNLALDGIVLREATFEGMDFVDVVSEGCLGVVQRGLEIGEDGGSRKRGGFVLLLILCWRLDGW